MDEQDSNQNTINGNVNTEGGDFVGRDQVTHIHYVSNQPSANNLIVRQLEQLSWKAKEDIGVKNYVVLDLLANGYHTTCDEFVTEHSHVVLHGQPGCGKSTLLWHILAQTVENYLEPDGKPLPPLPFYVSFANWGRGVLLDEFLKSQWPYGDDTFDDIASRSVWLFADGIDECESFNQARLIELWSWLQQKNAPIQALLTCRTETYREIWQSAIKAATNSTSQNAISFPHLGYRLVHAAEITTPLSESQFDKFVVAYLGERSYQFKQALQHNRPRWLSDELLKVQTRNTQQLVLLLQAYREEGKLPSNYGRMVESYVKSLWLRPSLMQTDGWVPFDEMCAALAAFSEGFPRYESRGYVGANNLLASGLYQYARQGRIWLKHVAFLPYIVLEWICLLPFALGYTVATFLFFSRGIPGWQQRWEWSIHQFFNYFGNHGFEYRQARKKAADLLRLLIATKILQNDNGTRFENEYVWNYIDAKKRLHSKSYNFSTISRANWKLLQPSSYEEVKIAAGLMDKPLELIQRLGEQDPYVASECLLSGVQVDAGLRRQIIERTAKMMIDIYQEDPTLCLKCARVLGKMGDPTVLSSVISLFDEHYDDSQQAFNRELIDVVVAFGYDAIEPLLAKLENCQTRQLCAVAIALGRIGDRSAKKPLEAALNTVTDPRIRVWIIATLANLKHESSQKKIQRYLTREEPERYEEGRQCEAWRAFAETTAQHSVLDCLLNLLPGDKPSLGDCFTGVIADYFGAHALQPILKRYNPCESPELNAILAKALGIIGSVEAVPILLEDLQSIEYSGQVDDTHENWLTQVIRALGELKAIAAVDSIGCYLESDSWHIFNSAKVALGNIGNSQAVFYLSQFLQNDFAHLYDPTGCKFVPKFDRYVAKEDVALTLVRTIGTTEAMDAATPYYIQKLESLMPESEEWYYTEIELCIIGTERAFDAIKRIKNAKSDDKGNSSL